MIYTIKEHKINEILKNQKIDCITIIESNYLLVCIGYNIVIFNLKKGIIVLSINKFSNAKITYIEYIAKWKILLFIADYRIYSCKVNIIVESFKIFKEQPVNLNEKGIYSFSCYQDLLCIGMKKRILLLKRNDTLDGFTFIKIIDDIAGTVRLISFIDENRIWVGRSSEYIVVDLNRNKTLELRKPLTNGINKIPLITNKAIINNDSLTIITKDNVSMLIENENGYNQYQKTIQWESSPVKVLICQPYVVGILSTNLMQVYSLMEQIFIANISLSSKDTVIDAIAILNGSLINSNVNILNNNIIIQYQHSILILELNDIQKQIDYILSTPSSSSTIKKYILSLNLINAIKSENLWVNNNNRFKNTVNSDSIDKTEYRLCLLYSISLFFSKQFRECFGYLESAYDYFNLPYTWVMDFFKNTDLCDSTIKLDVITYDIDINIETSAVPILSAKELSSAIKIILIPLLLKRRSSIEAKIIDTILYKGYILCFDPKNSDLEFTQIRYDFLISNQCNISDAEQLLLFYPESWEILVWLYYGKLKHAKCLSWLRKLGLKNSIDDNVYMTKSVEYLQKLPELDDLVFEYSKWILKRNPKLGIGIFIHRMNFDKNTTSIASCLNHLRQLDDEVNFLEMAYLQYVIYEMQLQTSDLHNRLAIIYLHAYLNSNDDDDDKERLKIRLINFLKFESKCYNAAELLPKFRQHDNNFEAILLGKMGLHLDALKVIFTNESAQAAEEYCNSVIDNEPMRREVYLSLLNLIKDDDHPDMMIDFITRNFNELNAIDVINLLTMNSKIAIGDIQTYLQSVFQSQSQMHRQNQIMNQLLKNDHMMTLASVLKTKEKYLILNQDSICEICGKKFQNDSAFVRLPESSNSNNNNNNKIVHYACHFNYQTI